MAKHALDTNRGDGAIGDGQPPGCRTCDLNCVFDIWGACGCIMAGDSPGCHHLTLAAFASLPPQAGAAAAGGAAESRSRAPNCSGTGGARGAVSV